VPSNAAKSHGLPPALLYARGSAPERLPELDNLASQPLPIAFSRAFSYSKAFSL
jgi:hypothetical protein